MMGCSRLLANRRFECSGWHRNFSFSSMIKLTNRREDDSFFSQIGVRIERVPP